MENQKQRIIEMYEAEEARVLKLWREEKKRALELFEEEELNFKQKDNELPNNELYDELKEEIGEIYSNLEELENELSVIEDTKDDLEYLISNLNRHVSEEQDELESIDEKLNNLTQKNKYNTEEDGDYSYYFNKLLEKVNDLYKEYGTESKLLIFGEELDETLKEELEELILKEYKDDDGYDDEKEYITYLKEKAMFNNRNDNVIIREGVRLLINSVNVDTEKLDEILNGEFYDEEEDILVEVFKLYFYEYVFYNKWFN